MPSLAKYRKMRDFERTQEPRGKTLPRPQASAGKSFVVQKHAARHLHYDFRLELDGVLLSWAVPKGPSIDPTIKRLAMEVEPHPVEYGDFEGTIPKGEYGGGTVMVWDRGTWSPEGDPHQALAKGHLKFSLHGTKLKGSWHLVRSHGRKSQGDDSGRAWLLFKSGDSEAKEGETLLIDAPESALTGRSLEEIANDADGKVWRSNRSKSDDAPQKSEPKLRKARKALPEHVEPELATLVDEVPEGDDWVHEIKFDGYRIVARVERGSATLLTRSGKDWTARMPTLRAALEKLDVDSVILDGELVALDSKGISSFQTLQNSLNEELDGSLVYYAFDLLNLDGDDFTAQPLVQRKSHLRELLDRNAGALAGKVRLSAHVVGSGPAFFENACKLGLEGTIAKRADSTYQPGRGRDWLKIKCSKRQEFTIVGYTEPNGSRSHFGALLLGVERDGQLSYAGRVGTGFSEASLAELHQKLQELGISKSALANPPRGAEARGVHWVKPELVAEIRFTEMTSEGLLRHPTFQGLRDDKAASEVKLETAEALPTKKPVAQRRAAKPSAAKPSATKPSATKPSATKPSAAKPSASYPITNPQKVLYPEQGITKQELLDYYGLVAERMLPHVGNRPLTLVRCPNGRGKPCFFQKHPGEGVPPGMRSIAIREKEGKAPYSVIDDEQGLFGLVQLGALEIHTWGSRADDFEHPDILVFDLDPDPKLGYGPVIDAARLIRQVFESAKLETFVKTTGGKGLHVCVPIVPDLDWDTVKDFTGRIAEAMAGASPELYVATVSKAKRTGKTFIDYLRNGRGATFIAPYSTRARENAPVAVPLEWDELSLKLPPNHFTLRNLEQRLAKLAGDPWQRMTQLRQRLRPEQVDPGAKPARKARNP
jgi:bifunctional non-homologous end joining protein LigD